MVRLRLLLVASLVKCCARDRKWSETGIVIRDFEDGVRLDHIVKGSPACDNPDLVRAKCPCRSSLMTRLKNLWSLRVQRIGLQLARVGRFDTSRMHFDEVTEFITQREESEQDLILKFVRKGTAGMSNTTDFVVRHICTRLCTCLCRHYL
eukprot:SAG31_NODE_1099_length_9914_cov_6.721345_4_plen_150_part_00